MSLPPRWLLSPLPAPGWTGCVHAESAVALGHTVDTVAPDKFTRFCRCPVTCWNQLLNEALQAWDGPEEGT